MKRKKWKRIAAALAAAVMTASAALTAFAAEAPQRTPSVIDMSKEGSLKLTKRKSVAPNAPIKGVEYTIYRIAAISQGGIEDDEVKVLYQSLMEDGEGNVIEVPEISSNEQAEALFASIKNLDELDSYSDVTNDDGVVIFPDLELGIYLVYESQRPAGVAEGQSFIVSVPMTDKDKTNWLYDIEAEPKNTITDQDIDKSILVDENEEGAADDELSKAEDFRIGEDVPYQTSASVPSNVDKLKYYFIKDTLSEGLTYNGDLEVYVYREGKKTMLTEEDDYKVVPDGQIFTVYFRTAALQGSGRVYMEYSAKLNEKAKIGSSVGNINEVELSFSKNTSSDLDDEPNIPDEDPDIETVVPTKPLPIVYTYILELTKVDKDGNSLGAGVVFELRDARGTVIGTYTTDEYGKINIKSLEDGQYQLVETVAKEGYTLLKDPVIITVKSTLVKAAYAADDNGEYFEVLDDTSYYIKNADGKIFSVDVDKFEPGEFAKMEGDVYTDAKCEGPKVGKFNRRSESNTIKAESNYEMGEDGIIRISVVNKKGFNLPRTGGIGTYIFTIGGVLIMLAAAVLLLRRRRTNN